MKSQQTHQPPRAYSIADAVRALSISRASIYRYAKDGKIKLVKIGGRTIVPADEVERLVAGGAK